jgi:hypothetical protein
LGLGGGEARRARPGWQAQQDQEHDQEEQEKVSELNVESGEVWRVEAGRDGDAK